MKLLTRRQKTIFNFIISIFLLFLIWATMDFPSFSAEHAFLRSQKQYFIGPEKSIYEIPLAGKSKLMVSSDKNQIILGWVYKGILGAWKSDKLFTYARNDETKTTAVIVPEYAYSREDNLYNRQPILVFDNVPKAALANLYIKIGSETYSASAKREEHGFFCFYITKKYEYLNNNKSSSENESFRSLQLIHNKYIGIDYSTTVTLQFFDKDSKLLEERELTLSSNKQP